MHLDAEGSHFDANIGRKRLGDGGEQIRAHLGGGARVRLGQRMGAVHRGSRVVDDRAGG